MDQGIPGLVLVWYGADTGEARMYYDCGIILISI